MDNKELKNKIEDFLDKSQGDSKNDDGVVIIPTEKDGLIERVEKKFITEDGRQLL